MRKKKVDHEAIARMHISTLETERLHEVLEVTDKLKFWRKKAKLYSTYIKGIEKAVTNNKDSIVFPEFRLTGTKTGRLSCAGYKAGKVTKGVSFHTLPRVDEQTGEDNIRSLFIASHERDLYDLNKIKAFITVDYKQMELRLLAHISQDPNLIAAFKSGEDLHKFTASLVFLIAIADVTKDQRQISKAVSFLIAYGGSEYRLTKTANISLPKAITVIEAYKEAFPGIFTWMEEVKKEIRKLGYVETLFGRRRHLETIRSSNPKERAHAERQGVNYKIQSLASDILGYSVLDIDTELKKERLNAEVQATVHDSAEAISSLLNMKRTVEIIYDCMTQCRTLERVMNFKCIVDLDVDIDVGFSFGDGIKAVIKDGKLQNELELITHVLKMAKECTY